MCECLSTARAYVRVNACVSVAVSTCVHVGTLTLTLVGAVGGGWLPRLLVVAGAAAVTGASTRVVLAGTLQPVGTHRPRRGSDPPWTQKDTNKQQQQGLSRALVEGGN